MRAHFTCLILLFTVVSLCAKAQKVKPDLQRTELRRLGLVAELAYFKGASENAFINKISELQGIVGDDSIQLADTIVANYNTVKSYIDQFVLQLQTDLLVSNSTKLFVRIDNEVKTDSLPRLKMSGGKQANLYIGNLNIIYKKVSYFISSPQFNASSVDYTFDTASVNMPGVASMYPAYQDKNMKAGSVYALNSVLDHLRLADYHRLLPRPKPPKKVAPVPPAPIVVPEKKKEEHRYYRKK